MTRLLMILLMLAPLAACNCGPFGGSARLFDHQRDQPFGPGGRASSMQLLVDWDFVRKNDRAWWACGAMTVDVCAAVAACEAVLPRRGWSRRLPLAPRGSLHDDTFEDTRVIVCVDPVVALSVPVQDCRGDHSWLIEPDGAAAFVKVAGASVYPPRGYRYGTCIAYHPTVTVVMPGSDPPVRTIENAEQGCTLIRVWWGSLALVRSGERWGVIAHPVAAGL
ncbi:MAG: hypothetical protein U0637_01470 [Phycisphaerales bacterium]